MLIYFNFSGYFIVFLSWNIYTWIKKVKNVYYNFLCAYYKAVFFVAF